MYLEAEDHENWFQITKRLSTKRLHNLDHYWRNNSETSVDQELHSFVEMVLIEHGEKP